MKSNKKLREVSTHAHRYMINLVAMDDETI
jgi:hypothetical protein